MLSRHTLGSLIVVAIMAGSTLPTAAETPDPIAKERADKLYAAAERAYSVKDLEKAIQFWRAGYELWAAPAALYNLAQAFRILGDCEHANWYYRSFLRASPMDAATRRNAETAVAACDKVIASGDARHVVVSPLPLEEIAAVAPAPADAPPVGGTTMSLSPSVVSEGVDKEALEGAAGGAAPARRTRVRAPGLLIGAASGLGLALAGAGVGTAFSLSSLRHARDGEIASARVSATVANVAWAGTAVGGALALSLGAPWLVRSRKPAWVGIAPLIPPGGGGVVLTSTF